ARRGAPPPATPSASDPRRSAPRQPVRGIDRRARLGQLEVDRGAGGLADDVAVAHLIVDGAAGYADVPDERDVAVAVIDGDAVAEAGHLADEAHPPRGGRANQLGG